MDLRIPGTTPKLPCFRNSLSQPDIRIPSVVALIGPNGAGKTAVLRAMMAAVNFAASSYLRHTSGSTSEFIPFLSPEMRTAPTRVEVEFDATWLDSVSQAEASLLRYTLVLARESKFGLAPTRVDYEALHAFPTGRPRRILERHRGKPIYVARELGVRRGDDRLCAIPPNASVISALAEMNVDPFPAIARDIRNVQNNILGPDPWRPSAEAVSCCFQENQNLIGEVSDRLQRLDFGIGGMRLEALPGGKWWLAFDHEGLDMPVVLDDESAGTRHLVHIFPRLNFALSTGHLAIIDALDSDFHSDLSAEILGWFRRRQTNPNNAQLICSLHNLSVLDDLEKEEVFVVEKDQDGATHVHGARGVAGLRRDVSLQKQYRSGAIGGLPKFG